MLAAFLTSYAAHAAVIATIHLSAAPQNVTTPLLVLAIAHSFYFALWTRGDDWVAAVRSFRELCLTKPSRCCARAASNCTLV